MMQSRLGRFLLHTTARPRWFATKCNAMPTRQRIERTDTVGVVRAPVPHVRKARLRPCGGGMRGDQRWLEANLRRFSQAAMGISRIDSNLFAED